MGIGYYAPRSDNIEEIKSNLTRKDTHELTPHAPTATLAEKVLHYFAHAEHKAYPSNGIGQLQKQPVIVEALAYCGKETQTLYSFSEDGESNGTSIMGEEQPQIFPIEKPTGLTVNLEIPVKTLLSIGVSKDRICKDFGISNKTLCNSRT